MALIDLAIVAAFVLHAAAAGARNRRAASRNLDEYFLAGRSLSGWQAGLSMAATQFAADTPLLVTGLIATAGIFALWQLWIYALAFLLMGFALSSGWRRAGVLTDAELTELRYGGPAAAVLRAVKAVYFGTVLNCTVLAWVLLAAATIAGPFLRWDEWLPAGLFEPVVDLVAWVGVPLALGQAGDPGVWTTTASNLISLVLLLALVASYSATGGLRGVVATDIVQIGVMLAGTAAFAWIVAAEAGGPWAIAERIREQYAGGGPGGIRPDEILAFTPDRARGATPALLGMLGLLWLIQLNADGSGYLAQRTMACRSDRDARTAAVVFTGTQVVLRSLLWLPLGLGLLVLFPPDPGLAPELLQADREASYVRGMAELLPPGVKGLMLTGMLAAIASTVDTHLNWGASYWTHDIYGRFVCRAWRGVEPDDRAGAGGAPGQRGDPGDRAADHDAAHVDQSGLADQPADGRRDGRGAGAALDLVARHRLGGDRRGGHLAGRGAGADGAARRRAAGRAAAARGGARHRRGAGRHPARPAGGPATTRGLLPPGAAARVLGPDRCSRRRRARGGTAAAGAGRRGDRGVRALDVLRPGGRRQLAHHRPAARVVPLAGRLVRPAAGRGRRARPGVGALGPARQRDRRSGGKRPPNRRLIMSFVI